MLEATTTSAGDPNPCWDSVSIEAAISGRRRMSGTRESADEILVPPRLRRVEGVVRRVRPRSSCACLRHFRIPPEDAQDLIQEVCLAYIERADGIADPDRWFVGALRRACLHVHTKRAPQALRRGRRGPARPRHLSRSLPARAREPARLARPQDPRAQSTLSRAALDAIRARLRPLRGGVETERAPSSIGTLERRCIAQLSERILAAAAEASEMRRDGESGSSDFVALREAVAGRASRDTARAAVYRMLSAADRQPDSRRALRDTGAAGRGLRGLHRGRSRRAARPSRRRERPTRAAAALASHLAEIARVSPAEARQRAAAIEPQRLGAVARELVASADALAVEEPAGIALAGVAVAAVEAGRPDESDVASCDLRAVARRCLVEAAFRGGDLVAAEGSLPKRRGSPASAAATPSCAPSCLRVAAEIRSDQSRFDEARRLAALTRNAARESRRVRLEGRSRVTLAMKLFLAGRSRRSA
jgi:hypothetical protein